MRSIKFLDNGNVKIDGKTILRPVHRYKEIPRIWYVINGTSYA